MKNNVISIIIKIQNINKYKFPSCHYIILHIYSSLLTANRSSLALPIGI